MEKTRSQKMYHCPIEAVLGVIGGKYKTIILHHLLKGEMRYGELQRAVPQATAKMLTQQLRELEEDGVIARKVYPVVPPKTEYSITEYGRTLEPILNHMYEWGKTYMGERILKK